MPSKIKNSNPINTSHEVPHSLVFLSHKDYERLDPQTGEFIFHRSKEDHRNPFERDRARIIHSPFFRNLAGKSQVFSPNQSDFFRTRLTHSLEVAQIAKVMVVEICEKYRASDNSPKLTPWEQVHLCDLVEAVCLAHDIGHPPFGHIGEEELAEMMRKHARNRFEANAQNLRILTKLDKAYPGRSGFTRGVLAGIMKYKIKRSIQLPKFIYDDDWDVVEKACQNWNHDEVWRETGPGQEFLTKVKKARSLACQIMDLADEITYAGHDIEDVLHAPLLRYGEVEAITSVSKHIPSKILKKILVDVELESGVTTKIGDVQDGWKQLKSSLLEVLRSKNPSEFRFKSHIVRREHMNLACVSSKVERVKNNNENKWQVTICRKAALRSALIRYVIVPFVYQDSKLATLQRKGSRILRALFEELINSGDKLMPWDYREEYNKAPDPNHKARICCDYIAGMTEEYALRFYQRLFESNRGVLSDFF